MVDVCCSKEICSVCDYPSCFIEISKDCLDILGNNTSEFDMGIIFKAYVEVCQCASSKKALIDIVNGAITCKAFKDEKIGYLYSNMPERVVPKRNGGMFE